MHGGGEHQAMISLVTEALEKFPEARSAVLAAVERAEDDDVLN